MLEIVSVSVFYEVAALLVLATVVGLVGVLLRQPLIVSFIAVGILAGPSLLDIARSDEQINLLAELGIAVLLFLVGLKLDVKLVRTLGGVALTTGLGQVAFTSVVGFGICLALGLDAVTSLYIAVALTFSSTIIIVKLLSDKREIDSLHGRVALGFLIVQDLVVVLAMLVMSGIGAGSPRASSALARGRRSLLAYGALMLLGRRDLHKVCRRTAWSSGLPRAPELMVSLCDRLGRVVRGRRRLPRFQQGTWRAARRRLAWPPRQFREAMAARLAPLRDFLLLFFFIALGARLDLSLLGEQIPDGGGVLALRADRQSADRPRNHGCDGLSQAHRVPRRPYGRTDQRVLTHLHGCRRIARAYRGADTLGLVTLVGIDHDLAFDLHDLLFPSPLCVARAVSLAPLSVA